MLPFTNISGDPDQEYFTDGVAEEITTALERLRGSFVTARNSAFTYQGHAVSVQQAGRDLSVRYVLEGSVRKNRGPGSGRGSACSGRPPIRLSRSCLGPAEL